MRGDPKPEDLRTERNVRLVVRNKFNVSRSTVALFLHYPVSKAVFILPLLLESAPVHDHGKQ